MNWAAGKMFNNELAMEIKMAFFSSQKEELSVSSVVRYFYLKRNFQP